MKWLFFLVIFLIPFASAKINVVVSIPDFESIVKEIGENEVNVTVILPPGSDPHSFSITKEILDELKDADLIILANSNLFSYEKNLKSLDKEFLDINDYIKNGVVLLNFGEFKENPHGYWLYINNTIAIAKTIALKLIEIEPEKEAYFMENFVEFENELKIAYQIVINLSKEEGLYGKKVVAAVPGVCYIAKNVGLEADEILLTEGNALPSAEKLREIEEKLREKSYTAIILPEFLKNAKAGDIVKQIALDTNSSVVYVKFATGGNFTYNFYYNAFHLLFKNETSHAQNNLWLIYLSISLAILVAIEGIIIYKLYRRW